MKAEEILKLQLEERRREMERQCTPQIIHHYEVTCPDCGLYVPGHATGGLDICTCEWRYKERPSNIMRFSELKSELEKLPKTWIPALLHTMIHEAQRQQVFAGDEEILNFVRFAARAKEMKENPRDQDVQKT